MDTIIFILNCKEAQKEADKKKMLKEIEERKSKKSSISPFLLMASISAFLYVPRK